MTVEELIELIKKLEGITNREHWLVAYTNGVVEIHNDHKAIIYSNSVEEAKEQLIRRIDILNKTDNG